MSHWLTIFTQNIILMFQDLWAHRLRASLSILGIGIGIFCVISVQAMIDSVQSNIRQSFNRLGNDVVFVDRFPWSKESDEQWWVFLKRPLPAFKEYKALEAKLHTADAVAIRVVMFGKEIKYKNNTISNLVIAAPTHQFGRILNIETEKGRYFSPVESHLGNNVVLLGSNVAEKLFPQLDPIGKTVLVLGRKMQVVGVLKKEGKSILGDGFDDVVLMPYNYLRHYANTNDESFMPLIVVKAAEKVSIEQLKDDITSVLRAQRKLRPNEDNNFALNQLSLLTSLVDGIFIMINAAGFLIGIFSLLVGGFGIANIMFVSVKERTGIIGIKKSLGAKRRDILAEFLLESIILSILGGILGLAFVFAAVAFGNYYLTSFELFVSLKNTYFAIFVALFIGVVSGIIPAIMASRMDPVEAIRQNF